MTFLATEAAYVARYVFHEESVTYLNAVIKSGMQVSPLFHLSVYGRRYDPAITGTRKQAS